jgi:DNA-binding PadR family transcriptional regulator
MTDLKLTPSLLAMLERIERHSGSLLMLAVTASGGREYGKLNKLRGAGYVVKYDHPSVTEGAWPAEALAITEAGRTALAKLRREAPSLARRAKHPTDVPEKKGRRRSGLKSDDDKRVVFRRDGERYIVFLEDARSLREISQSERLGFVRRADNGSWNFVDSTMAHSSYTKTRQRAGQILRRRFEQMVRQGEI